MRRIMHISVSSGAFLGPQNATKSLAFGVSPQAILGELTALPILPSWVYGAYFKAPTPKESGMEGMGRKGPQNNLCPEAPETLAPPLLVPDRAGGPGTLVCGGRNLKLGHWFINIFPLIDSHPAATTGDFVTTHLPVEHRRVEIERKSFK